jgi:hypothetical protein
MHTSVLWEPLLTVPNSRSINIVLDVSSFLYYLTLCAWIIALLLLCLKLGNAKVDAITSYGKFAITSTNVQSCGFLTADLIPLQTLFTSIYLFASIWNAFLFLVVIAHALTQNWSLQSWIRMWWDRPAFCLTTACPAHYVMMSVLYELHVLRRLVECLWVHRFSPRRTSLLNFGLAHAFYIFAPLALAAEGAAHFCRRDRVDRDSLLRGESSEWYSSRVLVSLVIFVSASWLQHSAHRTLRALRRGGTTAYSVPHSGAFTVLVAPHYTAEMLIYLALALLGGTWRSLWTLVTLFVFVNLTQAAHKTREWYWRTFSHSALLHRSKRYILIPYVY